MVDDLQSPPYLVSFFSIHKPTVQCLALAAAHFCAVSTTSTTTTAATPPPLLLLSSLPPGGDVLCAWLRRPQDDSMAALLQPKRRRHALATSFAILDAHSYSEIANVQVCAAVCFCCFGRKLVF
jgi:hypothetical protein